MFWLDKWSSFQSISRHKHLASSATPHWPRQCKCYCMWCHHTNRLDHVFRYATSVVLGSVVHGGISSSFLHMVCKNRKRSVYSLIYWLLQTLCVFVIVIQIKWKCQWKPYQKKRGKIGEKSFCRYRFYTAFVNDKHQKGRCCNSQISI